MSPPQDMDSHEIAKRCWEEMRKSREGVSNDERYCLELWRGALHDKSEDAWGSFVETYSPMFARWLRSHYLAALALRLEDEQYYITETFMRLWMKGEQVQIGRLDGLHSFARRALNWVVLTRCRSWRADQVDSIDTVDPGALVATPFELRVEGRLDARHLWDYVMQSVKNKRERLLAYLLLIEEYTPLQVCQEFPSEFPDVKRVHRMRENLIDRIKRRCPEEERVGG